MITHFLSTNELQIYTYNRKIIAKILTFNRPLWVTKSTGRLSLHILHTTYHTSALTAVLIHRDLHITVACGHQLQTAHVTILTVGFFTICLTDLNTFSKKLLVDHKYWPKCGDVFWPGSKGSYDWFNLWIKCMGVLGDRYTCYDPF